jgi:hypothetical protein
MKLNFEGKQSKREDILFGKKDKTAKFMTIFYHCCFLFYGARAKPTSSQTDVSISLGQVVWFEI